jgi:hypothetical protein
VLEVVRVVFAVWAVKSWVARVERAAWVVVRSWRRRVISSVVVWSEGPLGAPPEVAELGARLLRSARRVSEYC